MQSKLFFCAIFEDQLLAATLSQHLCRRTALGGLPLCQAALGGLPLPLWEGCDSQTDKCLGRPITKQWGSAARHSKTRPTFASEANLRGKLTASGSDHLRPTINSN